MAGKRVGRSSYDEYIDALNKINPQLRTLLSHISTVTEDDASAGYRKGRCATTGSSRRCTPVRKRNMCSNAEQQEVQAVTNSGKIVYGVMRDDGVMEVRGSVGEINDDLLGVATVNAGRRTRTSSSTRTTGTKRGAPSRRRRTTCAGSESPDHSIQSDYGGME
ncbi:virion core and cleavage processing protein [Western grey kangaroopox virus]|uniref:25 kDa core protein OPG138 n=1 Tax=Western grey kangaroopox virus TaxID=1566307 RepID=A0A2C9DSR5_9POXV|nr:virion core and cleavage processing protein [Western grey kangaroopox virus]ATI21048.1 virion core and cleavage processing protein [Western grey kangaroopox virus]